jgi:AcrR family transcriptional regulator
MAGDQPSERKDAARNRERILEAAQRLLAMHGPDGITMDAVAKEAGVGKGTIFRRFGDREGLAEALIDAPMRAFQDRVIRGAPPLGPGAPAAERLEAFITELLRFTAEHLEAVVVASAAPGHRRRSAFGFLLLHTRLLVREIDPHLDDGIVAQLLLGALSPPIVVDARTERIGIDAVVASALALLRGLTSPPSRC